MNSLYRLENEGLLVTVIMESFDDLERMTTALKVSCNNWNDQVVKWVALNPTYVPVTSSRSSGSTIYSSFWQALQAIAITINNK